MTIDIINTKVIEEKDFSKLVSETYERPYDFQQHGNWGDAIANGSFVSLTVPEKIETYHCDPVGEDYQEFDVWKTTPVETHSYILWQNSFYPRFQEVANDLHAKGLLPAGDYTLLIHW